MPNSKRYEKITITDFAAEGKCIYKSDEGVIFIQGNVAPGDVVDIEITSKRKKFKEAIVTHIHGLSNLRAEPYCQHFDLCGGCRWQHINYDEQLRFKKQQVIDHFVRIGKLHNVNYQDVIPARTLKFYRNKLEFTFSNNRWLSRDEIQSEHEFSSNALGYHVPKRFDRIFHVEKCHLQAEPSNTIRNLLQQFTEERGYIYYDVKKNVGMMRNLIIRTSTTGDVLVIIQFAQPNLLIIREVLDFLVKNFPEISSLFYIINQKGNDSYQDQEVIHYFGAKYIREQMEDLTFMVGPKSFYQTNSEQAFQLYKVARDFAEIAASDVVYDLYTGTGTIANFVARQVKKVIGVEYVEEAVQDARKNSEMNGIINTEFFAGDMKKILDKNFCIQHGRPDVIITDPPRAGMDPSVIETILAVEPKKIVYVSCNTATQARDLDMLSEKYYVSKAQPVDMFPHTHHVENVAQLIWKGVN